MIIFICGTSSSGKSTICHKLHAMLDSRWLNFSTDGYLSMLGNKFLELHPQNPNLCDPNDICYAKKYPDGTYEIVIGKQCSKLNSTIPEALKVLAQKDFNIIVDSLITSKNELKSFKAALKDFDPIFVYLLASENTVSQREQLRANRLAGSAIHWLRKFDFTDDFDLIIDTDISSTEKAIDQIMPLIDNLNQQ